MPRSLLALAIVLLVTIPLYADYHYASHTGTNTYPYTSWETATDSIKYAITAADPGDTVYIGAGTFYEKVNMTGADSSLSLIGVGMDSTHWWFNDPGDFTLNCSDNTFIQGIHFYDTEGPPVSTYFNNAVSIDRCHFTLGGINIFGGCWVSVSNCIFDSIEEAVIAWLHNYSYRITNNVVNISSGPAFAFLEGDTSIIENNIILNVSEHAIRPHKENDTSLVRNNLIANPAHYTRSDCWDCRVVINNTFDNIRNDNGFPWSALMVTYYGYQNIRNNSFSQIPHSAIQVIDGNPRQSVEYSNLWGVDSLAVAYRHAYPIHLDTLGITWNYPMFVSPDSLDFRLQAYSPLIDAGDPSILDVDGSRSDIGCYGGPGGCSYVYLDLAPKIPDSLSARVDSSGIHITWRNNYEADFNRYQVFRDTVSGFPPSVFNMIGEPDTSYFLDTNISPGVSYYYRFASLDNQGNVSDHSTELVVYQTGLRWDNEGNLRPEYSSIETAYPNPFNQDVTIVYSASKLGPQPPEIKLVIYDIQGREIRTLVDERKPMGTYRVSWDGKDDKGQEVSSGTYLARLTQWGMGGGDYPIKITLVR